MLACVLLKHGRITGLHVHSCYWQWYQNALNKALVCNQVDLEEEEEEEEVGADGLQKSGSAVTLLYGHWQTEEWKPPVATSGIVPKNERGTVHCPPFASALPSGMAPALWPLPSQPKQSVGGLCAATRAFPLVLSFTLCLKYIKNGRCNQLRVHDFWLGCKYDFWLLQARCTYRCRA